MVKLVEALSVEAASACADMMADMERYEGGQLSGKDAISALKRYDAMVSVVIELEESIQQRFGNAGKFVVAGSPFGLTVPRTHSDSRI